mgnify:CR=1 FL=1
MNNTNLQQYLKDIVNEKQSGKTYAEIASKYNTSTASIGRLLRKNGYSFRTKHTTELADEICNKYVNNEKITIKELANFYKLSESTISQLLKERGIDIRTSSTINRKYIFDEHYFDCIDNNNKAYILGLLFADGCNTKKGVISLSLQEKDKDILEKIKSELKYERDLILLNYKSKSENWSNQYLLRFSSKYMSQQLSNLGMLPNKSLILTFPQWLDKKYYSHFIRGYFDGDGCIPKNLKEKHLSIVGTLDFCTSIKEILSEEININSSISYCHGNTASNTRVLYISGKFQTEKFLNYIYNNAELFIGRKHDLYLKKYKNINNSLTE